MHKINFFTYITINGKTECFTNSISKRRNGNSKTIIYYKMEEIYVKENKIFELTQKESEQELIRSIIEAKRNLEIAHNNFEYAEKDLIDYYTYQIKANSEDIGVTNEKTEQLQKMMTCSNDYI